MLGRAQGPTAGPRLAAQGLAELPGLSPSRPCPAAGRSGRLPSSRPCEAKCLDHPASSRSPAGPLLFSFGGARADPRPPPTGAGSSVPCPRPAAWPAGLTRAPASPGSAVGLQVPWAVLARGEALPQRRHAGSCHVGVLGGSPAHRPHGVQEEQGCPTCLGDPEASGPPPGVRELSLEAVWGSRLLISPLHEAVSPLSAAPSFLSGGLAPTSWVGERPLSAQSAAWALLL